MFTLKRKYKSSFVFFEIILSIFCITFFGCSTIPEDPVVEFSQEKSYEYSLNEINSLKKDKLTRAISESWLLCNSNDADEKAFDLFYLLVKDLQSKISTEIENEDFTSALKNAKSLAVLSTLPRLDKTENFLSISEEKKKNYLNFEIMPKEFSPEIIQHKLLALWQKKERTALLTLNSMSDGDRPLKTIDKLSSLIPGTVTIWVDKGIKIEKGQGVPERIIGSGFFIDSQGYIVTNYHVISSEVDPTYEGFSRLYIKMSDDNDLRIPAKVIGWDSILDLALIKADVKVPVFFKLGSSTDLDVGDRIYAIGSPGGLEKTLTSGVVSAVNRRIFSVGATMQIDAPINHGNSGGPIIDSYGRVQAVVFAGIENYEGLNFAIPVELLKLILPDRYEGGEVSHPGIGAGGKSGKEVDNSGKKVEGASVLYIMPGSPASAAGIPEGSVITECNGYPVKNLEQLQTILMTLRSESLVKLTADKKEYLVSLEKRPKYPVKELLKNDIKSRIFYPVFGMKTENLNSGYYPKFFITEILTGSNADESGLSIQDPFVLKDFVQDDKLSALLIQIQIKRRKSGYMEVILSLGASLDSPNYF